MRPHPLPTLDPERDREQILANRQRLRADLPEAIPFIKELLADGLLDGWRSVTWVGDISERPPGMGPANCVPLGDLAQFYTRPKSEEKS